MAGGSTSELELIFKQVPLLAEFRPEDFQIRPLPGFTNQNLHLKNSLYDWVLRIPKLETNRYINRKYEGYNADIASRLGIAAECLWRNDTGLSLSATLLNSRSLNSEDLANSSISKSLIETVVQLHKSKSKFVGNVDLAELLTRYYRLVPESLQSQIESSYKRALNKVEFLFKQKSTLVPSHNDMVLENILIDTAEQIRIIDWEYASMASPYWDLATLCNSAKLNRTRCDSMLEEYNKHNLNLDSEILCDYRYMLEVLSICWMAAFTEKDIRSEIENLNARSDLN